MSFRFSSGVDKNKLFLVKRSELESRLDPIFALYLRRTTNFKYSTVKLSKLLKNKPLYGANEPGILRQSRDEPRYIRITDIDEYGLLKKNIGKTANKIEPQYFLSNNDMLFARSGATVGKVYIHKVKEVKDSCFFAGYMIRFVFADEKINPDYVFIYTQLGTYKEWVKAIQRAAGQPNINAEEYKSLIIPIPPKTIQAKIVAKMDKAYSQKKQKEAEAQRLLDSIDDYLLGELGIELPEQQENSIQSRIFTRKLSKVSGGRFDAFYHSLNKEHIIGKYKFYNLKLLASIQKGTSITSNDIREGDIPVIAGGQTSPYKHNISNFDGDVITVSASGAYSGYVWYHRKPIFASDCTVISSNDKAKLLNTYLFEYLKLEQQYIYNLQQGSGQPHIYPSDLEKIRIPVPPLKKQNEIANHITDIRKQAKKLQQQAKDELEKAKQEVETMILGD